MCEYLCDKLCHPNHGLLMLFNDLVQNLNAYCDPYTIHKTLMALRDMTAHFRQRARYLED